MTPIKQTMLLNQEGILLDSCDSLFNASQFQNKSIIPHFPLIESVFDHLWKRLEPEERIIFPAVATKHPFLPGYYDYSFKLVESEETTLIQWQILDATTDYKKIKAYQQTHHQKYFFLRPPEEY